MFGRHEPHFPQQLLINLSQGSGQVFDVRMLVGCDLFDLQPQLFDLLSERSHEPAPRSVPAGINGGRSALIRVGAASQLVDKDWLKQGRS
jgi:hypothetical protein